MQVCFLLQVQPAEYVQKSAGGSNHEKLRCLYVTNDGGVIAG